MADVQADHSEPLKARTSTVSLPVFADPEMRETLFSDVTVSGEFSDVFEYPAPLACSEYPGLTLQTWYSVIGEFIGSDAVNNSPNSFEVFAATSLIWKTIGYRRGTGLFPR